MPSFFLFLSRQKNKMTDATPFWLLSFALFSFADLRYRLVPAIEIFFLASLFIAASGSLPQVLAIVLAVAWGIFASFPGFLVIPALFFPPAWILLLTGFGVRRGLIGRADLLALAGIASLFPWTAVILSVLGVELWRRWWRKRYPNDGLSPALPGMLLGLSVFSLAKWLWAV
jgi:hypothetical protein